MRGQDDASVLNMESILLLERRKAVDLELSADWLARLIGPSELSGSAKSSMLQ